MVSWPPDWQQRIFDALTAAGADGPCPRCGHETAMLQDGFIELPLLARLREGPVGSVSVVATICERCGFLSQHVANVLLARDIEQTGGELPENDAP